MDIIQNIEVIKFELNKLNICRLNDLFFRKNVVRFSIVEFVDDSIVCDYSYITENDRRLRNIFEFNPRKYVSDDIFTAVIVIPTGINARICSNSSDACTAISLIGNSVDRLITHPNVVNVVGIDEMTSNIYCIEGSMLDRFMMGTIGLSKQNHNRILLMYDEYFKGKLIEDYVKEYFINVASSLRMVKGNDVDVIGLKVLPEYRCISDDRDVVLGKIMNVERFIEVVDRYKDSYDCFALYTVIETEDDVSYKYFVDNEIEISPWYGLEAMVTNTISNICNVKTAHIPMLVDKVFDYSVVDPVKFVEMVSKTELFCLLKGLSYSPKIVEKEWMNHDGVITNENISCLIIPDKCIGLPVLAALEQDIPVIAVEDNQNLMENDLESLPWKPGKFFKVKNYFEVVDIINCLKYGMSIKNSKRSFKKNKYFNVKDFDVVY